MQVPNRQQPHLLFTALLKRYCLFQWTSLALPSESTYVRGPNWFTAEAAAQFDPKLLQSKEHISSISDTHTSFT